MPTPFRVREGDDPGRDLGEWDDDGNITIPGTLTAAGGVTADFLSAADLSLTGDLTVDGVLGVDGTSFLASLQVFGDLSTQLATSGFLLKEGTDAPMGIATLVGGTLVVANTRVTASSRIFLTCQTPGGTPGFLRVSARSAGVSFTILSSSGTDTSDVAYLLIEPT